MKKPLFPNVPEDPTQLSDDELAKLIEESEAGLEQVEQGETDGRTQAELYEEVKQGVEALERLRETRDQRTAQAEEQAEKMAELLARGRRQESEQEPEPEPEPEAEEESEAEEVEGEVVEEAVAASAKPPARAKGTSGDRLVEAAQAKNARLRVARSRVENRPTAGQAPVAITASSDIPGFNNGQSLAHDRLEIARAMQAKFRNLGASTVEVKAPVAKFTWQYPDERVLGGALTDNGLAERIRNVIGDAPIGRAAPEAITASGGLCAPVEIRYDLEVLAQADRPVRDSLPNFNAARGGIRFPTPPSLSSATGFVGRITEAQDAAGGSAAVKACAVIDCPDFNEVDVAAIYHCIQFGNLGARAYPELVQNAVTLTLAAQARLAETALLDTMTDASTHATVNLQPDGTSPLGATATFLPALLRASTALRNRQRMDPEAILDVQLPAWTLDLLTSDLVRSAFDRFAANDGDLIRTMQSYGLRVNFYWDGPTDAAQVFGTQTDDGGLLEFPPTIEVFLYPAGSYLLLDAGALDLGLVRDSVLNATNDYQMFAESWENLAFVGLESLNVTVNVCDTGAVAAGVASVCGS